MKKDEKRGGVKEWDKEELELFAQTKSENPEITIRAINTLIIKNLKLVWWVVKKIFKLKGILADEAFSEGVIGLRKSIVKFNPAKKCRFSTYARWWIAAGVLQCLQDQRTIRLPEYILAATRKYAKEKRRLEQKIGRKVSVKEIFQGLNFFTQERHRKKIKTIPFGKGDLIADNCFGPKKTENLIWRQQLRGEINKLLDSLLTPQEKTVITERFLQGEGGKTLREIGDILGFSKQWAQKLEISALQKLKRHPAVKKMLGPFYDEL